MPPYPLGISMGSRNPNVGPLGQVASTLTAGPSPKSALDCFQTPKACQALYVWDSRLILSALGSQYGRYKSGDQRCSSTCSSGAIDWKDT